MQRKYDKVNRNNAIGLVEQVYSDLNAVVEDEKEAKEGASFLGIANFGEKNKFIVNKNLAAGSADA